MMLAWSECEEKVASGAWGKEDETLDNQALSGIETEILNVFPHRYDWRLPVALAPSDQTFASIARVHKSVSPSVG